VDLQTMSLPTITLPRPVPGVRRRRSEQGRSPTRRQPCPYYRELVPWYFACAVAHRLLVSFSAGNNEVAGAGQADGGTDGLGAIGHANEVDSLLPPVGLQASCDFRDDGLHILYAWVFCRDHGQVGSTSNLAHQPPLGHIAQSCRTEDGNHPLVGGNQFAGHGERLLEGMWRVSEVHPRLAGYASFVDLGPGDELERRRSEQKIDAKLSALDRRVR